MGTLTAGIKEIFSSAKTTGSNVMLCGNDGTPDGHMTMTNLVSVLGVSQQLQGGYFATTIDALEPGVYSFIGGESIPNVDVTGGMAGFIVVYQTQGGAYRLQKLYLFASGLDTNQEYIRTYNNGWKDWVRCDNFKYNTFGGLASAIGGLVSRETITASQDCNDFISPGVYRVNGYAAHAAYAAGHNMLVINANGIQQLVFSTDHNCLYFRSTDGGTKPWKSWVQITGTSY